MLLFLIFTIVLTSAVVRLILAPLRYGLWRRRFYGYPYGRGMGYGCGWRRPRLGGGLLPLLAFLAAARILGRRF
jgi:hypothetical protein